MSELILVELRKQDVADALRRQRAGEDPAEICAGLWAGRPDVGCLLCDGPAGERPFAVIVPNPHDRAMMTAAPLCQVCSELPVALRAHRSELMLRRMWSKPGGKQCHLR